MSAFDVVIIGAGAAGMFCAGVAGRRGARVLVIDHAQHIGEKIRISGGGRCNFTNLEADRIERYLSQEPRFARHALRGFTPRRFTELLRAHGIGFHEKHRGQLFCDDGSEKIITLLRDEANAGAVNWQYPSRVQAVRAQAGNGGERFAVDTDQGTVHARSLVIATGGPSIPKIGATDFGHRLARQFGLGVIEPRPALVPLTFSAHDWAPFVTLAGVALPVGIRAPSSAGSPAFDEDLLFTHRGLSGPAVLQVSSFWRPGEPIEINLLPGQTPQRDWISARDDSGASLARLLGQALPKRLGQLWLEMLLKKHPAVRAQARLAEVGNRVITDLAQSLQHWRIVPDGSEGWRKAEVSAGGVRCDELDARTLESHRVPGLHFIGEVVDVTGWLGGYNFQWAWSSAHAAAMGMTA